MEIVRWFIPSKRALMWGAFMGCLDFPSDFPRYLLLHFICSCLGS